MSFFDLLDSMKGKALDLTNLELIKHTFSLQEQNNDQLRKLNDAYEKNIKLKDDEIERLKCEIQKISDAFSQISEELNVLKRPKDKEAVRYPDFIDIVLNREDENVLKSQINPQAYGHQFFQIASFAGLSKAKAAYCAEKLEKLGLVYIAQNQMALTARGREFLVFKKFM